MTELAALFWLGLWALWRLSGSRWVPPQGTYPRFR